MKNIIAILVSLGLAMLGTCADMQSVNELADKYFREWSIPRPLASDGEIFTVGYFRYKVPPSLQEAVIDSVMEKAMSSQSDEKYDVIQMVLIFVRLTLPEAELPARLSKNVHSLVNDRNPSVRGEALEIVGRLGQEQDLHLFLDALNDPADEVRVAAIQVLRARPNATATYMKYVNSHKDDPLYAISVEMAKAAITSIAHNAK